MPVKKHSICTYSYPDGTKCTRTHRAKGYCAAHYVRHMGKKAMDTPFRNRLGWRQRRSLAAKKAAQTRWASAAEKSDSTEISVKVSEPSSEKLNKLVIVTGMDVERLAGRILDNALKGL